MGIWWKERLRSWKGGKEWSRSICWADRWCDGGRERMWLCVKDFFKVECFGLSFPFSTASLSWSWASSPSCNAEKSTRGSTDRLLVFESRCWYALNDPPNGVLISTNSNCVAKFCSNPQQCISFPLKIPMFPKIPNQVLQPNFGEICIKGFIT